ncbi:hypothetical protein OUZ56_025544 [Daphnia magna]|uniref:Uncharacterized protein n=1 Tax=Daphnia magna TaxID=35525 RepID=A0ABQ9ZK50_9CRUS|nr:hypothetical protein OUZ56_025544 [Daphnia magna]
MEWAGHISYLLDTRHGNYEGQKYDVISSDVTISGDGAYNNMVGNYSLNEVRIPRNTRLSVIEIIRQVIGRVALNKPEDNIESHSRFQVLLLSASPQGMHGSMKSSIELG